jgi:hypothetical protein
MNALPSIEDLRQRARCRVPKVFFDYAEAGPYSGPSEMNTVRFGRRSQGLSAQKWRAFACGFMCFASVCFFFSASQAYAATPQPVLLLDGETFADASGTGHTVVVNGATSLDTTQSVFGSSSIKFGGWGVTDYAALAQWQAVGGTTTDRLPLVGSWDLVIDGLFGIGLSRDIEGRYADWISIINHLGVPVLALDIPSGLDADTGRVHGCCVRATHTITAHDTGERTLIGDGERAIALCLCACD